MGQWGRDAEKDLKRLETVDFYGAPKAGTRSLLVAFLGCGRALSWRQPKSSVLSRGICWVSW
jgi:hypothetical protein